ncbi:MAG: CorA family divalent cation transporter, partial [Bacteroidota bacterium]
MARFLKHRKKSTGTVPGSLVFLGEQKESRVQITSMVYNQEALLQDDTKEKAADLPDIPDTNDILWLNVVGLHDTDIIREIGNKYKLHPLLLEDILNTDQRPKHEDFDDALLIIMKKLMLSREETNIIEPEQISLV